MPHSFEIGGRKIGHEEPPLFLPDIGTFFGQDVERAKTTICALKDAGAEMIKAEILHRADICLDDEIEETYFAPSKDRSVKERYRDVIERKVLPLAGYEEIFATCKKLGLPIIVSVYDFEGADFAQNQGAAALKIASSNIVHEPLIRYVANLGLPIILDTGRSSFMEIVRAVDWIRENNSDQLIIQHSPPAPPAPVEQQNLLVMEMFQRSFKCIAGLSDHHAGPEMLYLASALGVSVIEKGICRDDDPDDQDVSHALRLSQFRDVNQTCRTIWAGRGTEQLPPVLHKKISRMGIIADRPLRKGDVLNIDNVAFAFPVRGIAVEHWSLVDGWNMRRDVEKGSPIGWSDVEQLAP